MLFRFGLCFGSLQFFICRFDPPQPFTFHIASNFCVASVRFNSCCSGSVRFFMLFWLGQFPMFRLASIFYFQFAYMFHIVPVWPSYHVPVRSLCCLVSVRFNFICCCGSFQTYVPFGLASTLYIWVRFDFMLFRFTRMFDIPVRFHSSCSASVQFMMFQPAYVSAYSSAYVSFPSYFMMFRFRFSPISICSGSFQFMVFSGWVRFGPYFSLI